MTAEDNAMLRAQDALGRESDPLLRDLTEPQRQAVLHRDGPLLILAAAGSGKTRVITRRIARLIRTGVPPWAVLALTFTNKAAGEMRERVGHLLGEGALARGLTITTFHTLCARLLRRHAAEAQIPGLAPDFSIYDTDDQTTLAKRVLAALQLSPTNWPPRSLLSAVSNAKNELQDAQAFAACASDFHARTVAKFYTAYESAMRSAKAVDFDDLLLLTARMLRDCPDVRAQCTQRWRYVMIDEYQDTNRAQLAIATLIATGNNRLPTPIAAAHDPADVPHTNIAVVGDPDQSIYGWRGADIRNILDFEEQFPGTRVITLGQNFRSTAPILATADALIRHNTQRKHKDLFTTTPGGEKIEIVLCQDERHEAQLVAGWLTDRRDLEGLAWRDMAVFYRNNALSRVVEDALRKQGIPYVIARGTSFFQREEVRDALSYLRLVANPLDDLSLERVINKPARGIGDASIEKVRMHAAARGIPLFQAMREARTVPDLSTRARNAISAFVELLDEWTGGGTFLGSDVPGSLHELVDRVIRQSGLHKMYMDQAARSGSDADAQRLGNLDELVSSARDYHDELDVLADPGFGDVPQLDADAPASNVAPAPSEPPLLSLLRGFLERVSLVADADAIDPDRGAVTLMTLHAAKGLEFPAVAMVGLEQGTLPGSRAADSTAEEEEERRLCFVGITRAMRRLVMTSAKFRLIRGQPLVMMPSQFLGELDPQHLRISDFTGTLADGFHLGNPDEAAIAQPSDDDPLAPTPHSTTNAPARQELRYEPDDQQPGRRGPGSAAATGLRPGTLVRHAHFGIGKVLWVEPGTTPRARIDFRSLGERTLALEYARLQVIA